MSYDDMIEATNLQWRLREDLLRAVRGSDTMGATAILSNPSIPLDQRSDMRMVALCEAARLGDSRICRVLIRAMEERPDEYQSPLVIALDSGQVGVARQLALAGIGIDQKKLGRPYPVHLAATAGLIDLLRLILDHETVIDRRASEGGVRGLTALMMAARAGQIAAVQLLLDHGADPRLRDEEGHTPLDHALAAKHYHLVELLSGPSGPQVDKEAAESSLAHHRISTANAGLEGHFRPGAEPCKYTGREEAARDLRSLANSDHFRRLIAETETTLGISATTLSFAPWIYSFHLPKHLAADLLREQRRMTDQGAITFLMSESKTKARVCLAPTADPRAVILGLGVAAEIFEPEDLLKELAPLLDMPTLRLITIAPRELCFELLSDAVDIPSLISLRDRLGVEESEETAQYQEQRIRETHRLTLGWD